MRHTRDNYIWVGSLRFTLEDVRALFPAYALPDGISHTSENFGFRVTDGEIQQVALPQNYKDMAQSINDAVPDLVTVRENRIALEMAPELERAETERVRIEAERVEFAPLRQLVIDETEAAWLARTDTARWKIVLQLLKAIEKRI